MVVPNSEEKSFKSFKRKKKLDKLKFFEKSLVLGKALSSGEVG